MSLTLALALKVKNEMGVLPCPVSVLMINTPALPSRGPDMILKRVATS